MCFLRPNAALLEKQRNPPVPVFFQCHLFEDKDEHRAGRFGLVFHQTPVLVQLEVEGGHILHHLGWVGIQCSGAKSQPDLISILDPVARNVDHCPVEVALWENPFDVDVNDDHRVQGALFCRPHKSWSLLQELSEGQK